MDEGSRGFVNGGYISADYVRQCVAGWSQGEQEAPSQTITYLSCHDDWTLWDKLVYTMSPRKKFFGRSPKILRANRLAAAMNFCCQGYPFFLSGEEFARTKGGIKNSYRSHPSVNQLSWERAWANRRLVDYYRGLIALRKKLPCLCDKSPQASARICSAVDLAEGCVGISLDNRDGKKWDKVLLIFNGSDNKAFPRWSVTLTLTATGPLYDQLYDAVTGTPIEAKGEPWPAVDVQAYKAAVQK